MFAASATWTGEQELVDGVTKKTMEILGIIATGYHTWKGKQEHVDDVSIENHGNLRPFQREIIATGCQTWKNEQEYIDDVDEENHGHLRHFRRGIIAGARRRCRRRKPW